MNTEEVLFKAYKQFILDNSIFTPRVFNDTPQELKSFPTILFLENNNKDDITSTNRIEYVDKLQYKIEIYTKNKTIDGKTYARKTITDELKYLTFEFLRNHNLRRTDVRKAEYLDLNVDRNIVLAECSVNNWNGQIR